MRELTEEEQRKAYEITESIKAAFNGHDYIEELGTRIETMSKEQVTALLLIASNRIGSLEIGKPFTNDVEAGIQVCTGIKSILNAYDAAVFNTQFQGDIVGHS